MKAIILPNVSDVCTGEYDFSINSVVEDSTTKILQVLFELEHCDGKQFYLLQEYNMDLSNEDFYNLMYLSHEPTSEKPIVVDTEALILCGGTCDVVLDEQGKAKVDMNTISFSATIAADVE
ncbi:hypothetical protein [Anaerosporobacter sp.]